MSSYNLFIGGVVIGSVPGGHRILRGTLNPEWDMNGRDALRVTIADPSGAYTPAVGASVVLFDGALTIFAGVVLEVETRRLVPQAGLEHVVTAVSRNAVPDQRVVVGYTSAAGRTLKQVLGDLATGYLGAFGYTLSASQVDGPTLDALAYDGVCLTKVFNQLAVLAGNWAWDIAKWGAGELLMFDPTATPAPFSVTDADPHCLSLSVTSSADQYANRVYVRAGGTGVSLQSYSWTSDGSQTTYTVPFNVPNDINGIWPNLLITDGVIQGPISWGEDASFTWHWDWVTHSIINHSGTPLAAGVVVSAPTYNAQFPFTVMVEDASAATNPRELIRDEPDIIDYDAAVAAATQWLARCLGQPRALSLMTREPGLEPGQLLTVDVARPAVDTTFLITRVTARDDADGVLRYQAEGDETGVYKGNPMDLYREWGRSGAGGVSNSAVGVSVVAGNSSGAMSPVWLGGSRDAAEGVLATTWQPVRDYQEFWLKGEQWPVARVRVVMCAEDENHKVTARFYNLSDSLVVGTSDPVLGTTWTEKIFAVVLGTGWRKYRLELLGEAIA